MIGPKFGIRGIESVKIGDPGTDGAMGSTLEEIGDLVPDSVLVNFDEPEEIEIEIENSNVPWEIVFDGKASRSVEFATRRINPDMLVKVFGGTASDSDSGGDNDTWEAPVTLPQIEQSIELISKVINGKKLKVSIPLAALKASLNGQMLKNDSGTLKMTAKVKLPYDSVGEEYVSPIKKEWIDA